MVYLQARARSATCEAEVAISDYYIDPGHVDESALTLLISCHCKQHCGPDGEAENEAAVEAAEGGIAHVAHLKVEHLAPEPVVAGHAHFAARHQHHLALQGEPRRQLPPVDGIPIAAKKHSSAAGSVHDAQYREGQHSGHNAALVCWQHPPPMPLLLFVAIPVLLLTAYLFNDSLEGIFNVLVSICPDIGPIFVLSGTRSFIESINGLRLSSIRLRLANLLDQSRTAPWLSHLL